MTPERIAELRAKYAALDPLWATSPTWGKDEMMTAIGESFKAAKTVPALLDEIERQDKALAECRAFAENVLKAFEDARSGHQRGDWAVSEIEGYARSMIEAAQP